MSRLLIPCSPCKALILSCLVSRACDLTNSAEEIGWNESGSCLQCFLILEERNRKVYADFGPTKLSIIVPSGIYACHRAGLGTIHNWTVCGKRRTRCLQTSRLSSFAKKTKSSLPLEQV